MFDDPCSVNRRAEPECKPAWSAQFSGNDCRVGFQNGKTTPGGSRKCGKQRTYGSAFWDLWQAKELRAVFSDLWQIKDLGTGDW